MRAYAAFLKVRDWDSDYKSVQNLLNHLARKTQSEKSRANYLEALYHFCVFNDSKTPDQLVPKPSTTNKNKIDALLQSFIDDMKRNQRSIRYINVTLEQLKAFYRANGYKKDKEIEVERYHQSARYRKRAEYVPTAEEVFRMVNAAITPKWKAIVLTLYTTGFRNSTLRAILYSDIKDELGKKEVIHLPVYPEMKKLVPDACKNLIPYHAFLSKEATEGVRSYLAEYEHINGAKLLDSSPLFPSKGSNDRPMKARSIQDIIKKSARLAGIKQWKDVYPHCIRKSFENAVRNSGLDVKDQEFLMGHILPGAQDTYMDKTRIEEFRSKHERIKFFQQTDPESMRRQAAKDQLNMLEALGVLPKEQLQKLREELDQTSMDKIDWTEVVKHLRKEAKKRLEEENEMPQSKPKPKTDASGKRHHQNEKTVTADEAEGLIGHGWTFVGNLSNGKVVVSQVDVPEELEIRNGMGPANIPSEQVTSLEPELHLVPARENFQP